jgi:hypothetical protein
MIYLHTKFHMSSSNVSFLITIIPKPNLDFEQPPIFIFHKRKPKKIAYLSKICYHTVYVTALTGASVPSTSEVCMSDLLVLLMVEN